MNKLVEKILKGIHININQINIKFLLKMIILSLLIIVPVILLFFKTYPLMYEDKANNNNATEVLYTSAKITDEDFLNKIKQGNIQDIRNALNLGANPNAVDNINRNAMITAAIFNSKSEIIPLLVKYGININHQDVNGYNALMMSILSGSNNSMFSQELIKEGINVNAKTNSGISVLMVAAGSSNDEKLIESLIKAGANVNYKNEEDVGALMVAAKITTNPKVIETLLKYGANPKDTDSLGISVYEIAQSNKAINQNTQLLQKLK